MIRVGRPGRSLTSSSFASFTNDRLNDRVVAERSVPGLGGLPGQPGAQGDGGRPQPAAPAAGVHRAAPLPGAGPPAAGGGAARQGLSAPQPKVKGSRVPPLSSTQTDFVSR